MKNIVKLSMILLVLAVSSCKNNKTELNKEALATESAMGDNEKQLYSCPMHPEVHGKQGEACSVCGMELSEPVVKTESVVKEVAIIKSQSSFSIETILDKYLKLKNALTNDDSKGAAQAGKELQTTLKNSDADKVEAKLKKQYATISDGAQLHAEQISNNAGKIDLQRKDFALLSKDINDLIQMFKTDKKLYQDYCPMYDQGKSGYWISETKDIKNPYYGSEMLTCGGIHKEL